MDSYVNLPPETKMFLNSAMDIYETIKDKNIGYVTPLSLFDKRIMSLLAAAFITPGKLKNILDGFEDLKGDKVFEFLKTSREDIRPLNADYEEYYNRYFKEDLENMLLNNRDKATYKKTPVVIFSFFKQLLVGGSPILNEFAKYSNLEEQAFYEHPVFLEIDKFIKYNYGSKSGWSDYQEIDGSRENIENIPKKFPRTVDVFAKIVRDDYKEQIRNDLEEKEKRKKELDYWESDKLWDILDEIMAKFVGQEEAVENIFYTIVNNQRMALKGKLEDGERSVIFIDGPTGTGKTAIIREIASRLDIPFHRSTITNYSPTGYVGDDITSTLKSLLKCKDREKAERGIIVFDEFDKIVFNPEEGNSLVLKKAVQQQLLDFMGGGVYKVPIAQTSIGTIETDFDTSKLTFICLGALTNLREKKSTVEKSIGFNALVDEKKVLSYDLTPQDLIDLGYERELVGRLNTYLHTEEYSRDDLLRILKESQISPMLGFIDWVKSYGKNLVIEDGVYEEIADQAYKLNTGARSLQTIINSTRTVFLKQVMRSKDEDVYLDVETVRKVCENSFTRKSRR